MNELTVVEKEYVTVNGDEILSVRANDDMVYVPVKRICEYLHLNASMQLKQLRENDFDVVELAIVAKDGKTREMGCIPINQLNGMLFGISTKRIGEEYRPKLMAYKRECHDVLYKHWFKQQESTALTTIEQNLATLSQHTVQNQQAIAALTTIVNGFQQYVNKSLHNVKSYVDQQIEKIADEKAKHYATILYNNSTAAMKTLADAIVQINEQSNQAIVKASKSTNVTIAEFCKNRVNDTDHVSLAQRRKIGRDAARIMKANNMEITQKTNLNNKYQTINAYDETVLEQLFQQEGIPFTGSNNVQQPSKITH